MSRMKYMVGQVFKTKVNQQLVLGRSNGVPVPFGQVSKGRVDVPAGSVVHLVADYQAQDAKGGTKRAYVLQLDASPVYFMDHVLTRKYERILCDGQEQHLGEPEDNCEGSENQDPNDSSFE